MASSTRASPLWTGMLLAVLLWAFVESKSSISMDYCASINTASTAANHSIYQSDGLCSDFCRPGFALAIVHEDSCWCSNYVPNQAIQVSTNQCQKPCPGFPDDVCGGDGTYGYMLLSKPPSGTLGSPSSATSTSSAKVTTTETVENTFQSTVTYIPPSSSTASSDSSTISSTSSKTDDITSQQITETPTVSTVTAGGVVKTVTVTPASTPLASSANAPIVSETPAPAATRTGLSAGAAAGIAIAVVGAFLFVGSAVAWLLIKRRRARRAAEAGNNYSSNRGSSAGMTGTPRTGEMSEGRYYMGADDRPDPSRRRSTLMPVDPRLDPFAKGITLYNRPENKSHESVNTIRDDQDYSRRIQEPPRVLRAINPDSDID